MKFHVFDQKRNFVRQLNQAKLLSGSIHGKNDLVERETTLLLPLVKPYKSLDDFDLRFLLEYQIFPASILTFCAEWTVEGRDMRAGDVILQQVYLPPYPPLSVKCICAVKVKEVLRGADLVGFSYDTLEGHPERGTSAFRARLSGDVIVFAIHTFSAPGTVLTRLVARFITIPYQAYCTQKALETMKSHFLARNKDKVL